MKELTHDDVHNLYDLDELQKKLAAITGEPEPVKPASFVIRDNLDLGIVEMQVADQQFVFTAKQAQDLALRLRMSAQRIELRAREATGKPKKQNRRR
jgi:hypothetical protein